MLIHISNFCSDKQKLKDKVFDKVCFKYVFLPSLNTDNMFDELIELLRGIETSEDIPESFFDEMANATIAGGMALLKMKNKDISDMEALSMIKNTLNNHIENIILDMTKKRN